MVVNFNFNLEAWIKHLAIHANSEEEAKNKLMSMSLSEIMAAGAEAYSEIKLTEIESDIAEYDVVVKASNIQYDLDPEIMDISVIEYLKNFLPREYKVTLEDVTDEDDIEDLIRDTLFYETNYDVTSFDFEILETK